MTDTSTLERAPQQSSTEHFDVIIVGAGISGVGGAYHLTQQRPGARFVVLEALGRADEAARDLAAANTLAAGGIP